MIINGRELDFKTSRLKDVANYQQALETFEKKGKALEKKKGMSVIEIIKYQIDACKAFFVEATGVDVLEECDDLEEATDTYYVFLEAVRKQNQDIVSKNKSRAAAFNAKRAKR